MDVHVEPRNVTMLPEWQSKIDEEIAKLEEHHPGVIHHFRTTLIKSGHHKHGLFEVHLVASVPGDTIVVEHTGEEMYPLLIECFDTLDREMKKYDERRQQQVKSHEECPSGTIRLMVASEGYGFIESPKGDVYFHSNAVQDVDFEDLAEGDAVVYGEEMGEKGLQARWVRPA